MPVARLCAEIAAASACAVVAASTGALLKTTDIACAVSPIGASAIIATVMRAVFVFSWRAATSIEGEGTYQRLLVIEKARENKFKIGGRHEREENRVAAGEVCAARPARRWRREI